MYIKTKVTLQQRKIIREINFCVEKPLKKFCDIRQQNIAIFKA